MWYCFAELEIRCVTGVGPVSQVFQCESSNKLASVVCSFDGEPEESCSLPLVVEYGRFGTEKHTVVVNVTDVFGQTVTLTFDFQLLGRITKYD